MKIKRITPKSLAKMSGLLYAIFGFIAGLFFLAASLIAGVQSQTAGVGAIMFGIGAPILLPLFYGAMGVVFGAVTAWLYNFVAKRVGGIEFETE
ncbi:MAG: hypothetical protein G01um10148_1014 [Parcubacteria group bacterium Gr01-1014_8]|nr:MAG: hypothetical protein G01um10148_1014 [Parcubacteria group bacterium Gr01-1014_8]